ncbi:2-oxo acid dehydrogenase subunit E2 [Sporichthya sp.]|uniref:2-oxo acid dehydrogenase subunit E2 n=1 Tax=Sporichthya sp. TaxID=65475 RepID=UPI0017C7B9B2|nr:2-oxo acid dehydrogenase subunit E2 [Sporichthya sp.]MBA3745314.1 2-oxo acid dehydrogenase subunit E2 [Sporichthya sp.]
MPLTDVRPEWFTEEGSAEAVAGSFAATPDPRLRQILQSLVRHLHAFAKDVDLAQPELDAAIAFLTRTGQRSDATRQEFVLLSDVLGLSMLVDAIANRGGGTATESTVLGPFHMTASPARSLGECIADVAGGEPTLVTGCVRGSDGAALPGATIDVWQADCQGFYDVQRPEVVPAGNLRGLFTCDSARAGQLRPHELSGGTVTVSNLGMFGTVEFAAIINPPQASILAVGAATEVPAIVKGKLRTVRQLRVKLSVDHRPVDGAVAAEWMRAFTGLLENPLRILL